MKTQPASILAFVALAALVLAAPAPAAAQSAKAKIARCKITSADGRYTGPCTFTPDGKGSFSVTPVGRKRLTGQTTMISVYIVGPGEAEVSGLTTDGINSRWGAAARSKKDRACWLGSDFSVCVPDAPCVELGWSFTGLAAPARP